MTDEDERWNSYRGIVVSAELSPGRWVELTGASAVDPWPYPGAVHGVTAADPFGRRRPDAVNEAANRDLAARLVELGAGFHRAVGAYPGDRYAEAGFVVWGLDLDRARAVGAEFGQEAIFEIDAEEVRVVHCGADRVTTEPRLP